MRIEEEHQDVLQNIEFAVANLYLDFMTQFIVTSP